MVDASLTAVQDQLEEERTKLLDQLRQIGRAPGAEMDFDEGFADSGQVTAERGEVDALAGKLLANLEEVEEALAKIEAGTYGRCEDCGAEIGEARLEAHPSAKLCIACASKRR
jgi:RNA polymerase-binding transcription factor DksA